MKELTQDEQRVILHKATEAPYSGRYNDFYNQGIYSCKQCEAKLFRSEDKFSSGCGGHLGHVFEGEGFTLKNRRHCVNSISLSFDEK